MERAWIVDFTVLSSWLPTFYVAFRTKASVELMIATGTKVKVIESQSDFQSTLQVGKLEVHKITDK